MALRFTASSVAIFDLERKTKVDELTPDFLNNDTEKKARDPEFVSLAWSADGQTLFAGYASKISYRPPIHLPARRQHRHERISQSERQLFPFVPPNMAAFHRPLAVYLG